MLGLTLVAGCVVNCREALARFAEEMARWVEAAANVRSVKNIIPVNGAATPANAELLARRIEFLRERILEADVTGMASDC